MFLLGLVLAGCDTATTDAPQDIAAAEPGLTATPQMSGIAETLTNRIWFRTDADAPPGEIRVYLRNGTLVMDSCWEVYRLAVWEADSDSTVTWSEDGMSISADVTDLTSDRLTLTVHLLSGTEEQHYQEAEVPYVCPEMER
jgi:hypothetical protein